MTRVLHTAKISNVCSDMFCNGTYVFSWGWGGLGPQRGGSLVKVSTKRGG